MNPSSGGDAFAGARPISYTTRVARVRWRRGISRAALGVAMAGLLGGAFYQLGPVRHLRLEASPIVWLSAGDFVMGADDRELIYAAELCQRSRPLPIRSLGPQTDGSCAPRRFFAEGPQRLVHTAAYGIDRNEVSHARYRSCVAAGRCSPSRIPDEDASLAMPRMPVVGVTWGDARTYCEFAGGRLPTEAEWERAARGTRRHRFPWGRQYNSSLANHGRSPQGPDDSDGFARAAPIGSFPDGASMHGLLDAAGNAWEWTASAPRPADVGLGSDAAVYRVVRGGSWAHPAELMRVTHRIWLPQSAAMSDVGLRCAYDP